jgi:hypothetical protein
MVKRADALIVTVSEEMKVRARDFALKAVEETFDRFSYSKKERLEKVAWGKLGEEVLAYFLNLNGFDVEIDYQIYKGTTSTDETDFIINGTKIDLKVGTKNFHKRLLIVKSYFDNGNQSDYYIAVNFYVNANTAIIYGFATKDEIKNAPIGKWDRVNPVDDYTLLYDDLRPIKELLIMLDNTYEPNFI